MRVGFIAPASIAAVNGGVRTQALSTIEAIQEFDVEPILLSPWQNIEALNLNLIHIFGATEENIGISTRIKSMNIPFVLSPVFFANHGSTFINSSLKIEKITSLFGSGIRSGYSIKAEMCRQADCVLPNTTEEAELVENGLSIPKNKIQIVPNGVKERFAKANASLFVETYNLQDFVLFVGQAGAPRKNVIKLLEVAPKINAPIVIIGSFYDDEYGNTCRNLIEKSDNIHHLETLDHNSELLSSAYAAAKVFVLPSLYETPGIAALEAGLAGAHIVITKNGGTKDYFNSQAEFINPHSSISLLNGIKSAMEKKSSHVLKKHILAHYTWKEVARKTAENYKDIVA